MKNRKLWIGTGFLALMIGAGAPASAQQYLTRFKQNDKPAVEVDMSVLGDLSDANPATSYSAQQMDPAAIEAVDQEPLLPATKSKAARVADSMYVRSPAFEDKSAPAAAPEPAEDVTDAIIAPPAAKPAAVSPPPAAEKKKSKKTARKKSKNQPSLVVSHEPAPEAAEKPVPVVAGPIISQPPSPEPALAAPEHHDIRQSAAPIISNPPDTGLPPVIQGGVGVVPKPYPVETPIVAAPPMEAPENMMSAPALAPAPAVVSAPVPAIVTAPEARPEPTSNPSLAPLPDITVVHEADYPEASEPAVIAQPEPAMAKTPREEPPPLPKARKVGHTTAPEITPFQHQLMETAQPVPTPPATARDVAIEASVPPPAAEPVADESAMPVVPTAADLMLSFSGNSSDLTSEARKKLDAVIGQMKEMTAGRLQVRGFAAGEDGSSSSARRIALSRALSVRSYLMDKGIKPTRVDVRAMGSETERSPLDRVDLVFTR